MYKFGQLPRQLESFGVAGLLGEGCKAYYESIFSARHIGRVSDLMTAQLKRLSPAQDELRFRIILMFSLYEAYRCQLQALPSASGSDVLSEPLVIEFGVDREKLALGVSFNYSTEYALSPSTLQQKVEALKSGGRAEDRIESFIAQMVADSDQVVVRIEEKTRKIEVVSLLALPGKMDAAVVSERRPMEVVVLKSEAKISRLQAEYIELGDLDYGKLLSEDKPGEPKEKPATGEFLAESTSAEDLASTKIAGQKNGNDKLVRISGVTQHLGDGEVEEIKVVEESAPSAEETLAASNKELENAKKQMELYRAQIGQLQARLAIIEQLRQNETLVVSSRELEGAVEEEANSSANRSQSFKEIIQNLWPFNRAKKPADGTDVVEPSPEKVHAAAVNASESEPEAATDPAAENLLKEQVDSLQKTIERIQRDSEGLKKELGNGRAKKWADGMLGELVSEKARLNEMAKKLNVSFRQKEREFKNKEVVLHEELRRKDEQLKQKTYALERAKEQLAQSATSGDKNKTGHSKASEETQYRQKLLFTQKLLASAKEESTTLSRRLEEVRMQLSVAQSASKVKLQKDIDFDTMRSKHDRLLRQAEEFKRANHQLMEKLNEYEKLKPTGNPEELKKKLESAMKLAATHQKDSELFRGKIEEMEKNEARLKAELKRMTGLLRAMKTSQAA